MALLFFGLFVIGWLIGYIVALIRLTKNQIHGVIEVDHDTGMCRVRIASDGLQDKTCKTATFVVEHDAMISRNEQAL